MNASWRAKALAKWLILEPLPVWAAVCVPILGLIVAWVLPWDADLKVRIAGFAVTLAGVGLVVKGIRDKRRHFGRPTYFVRLRDWLARLPTILGGPRTVTGHAAIFAGSLAAAGTGHVRVVASPTASLEERLTVLEGNLKRIDERITGVHGELNKGITELKEALRAESSAREQMHSALSAQLEDLSAGGLDFEAVGVVWVIVGSALSTFPGEIARAVGQVL